MVVLWGVAVSYERGIPVPLGDSPSAYKAPNFPGQNGGQPSSKSPPSEVKCFRFFQGAWDVDGTRVLLIRISLFLTRPDPLLGGSSPK